MQRCKQVYILLLTTLHNSSVSFAVASGIFQVLCISLRFFVSLQLIWMFMYSVIVILYFSGLMYVLVLAEFQNEIRYKYE